MADPDAAAVERERVLLAENRLARRMFDDPDIGPKIQRLIAEKHPETKVHMPRLAMEDLVKGELEKDRKERQAEAAERLREKTERALERERDEIRNDPDLRISPEELPEVEKLMTDETLGALSHRAAARIFRASQQVAPGSGPSGFGSHMQIPGLDGAGGTDFDWLKPAISTSDKSVLDRVARDKADAILNDFRRSPAEAARKWG